ncbi:MAG: efflux RND transporter periplasmic adaptor subunit [Spirochaetia bacterium]
MDIRYEKGKEAGFMDGDNSILKGTKPTANSILKGPKVFLRAMAGVLLLTGLTLILVSCDGFPGSGGDEEEAEDDSQEESVFAVNTTEAKRGVIESYIDVNGDVVSQTTVETFPDNSGELTRFYVDQGDRVRKDQVIAEVDPSKPGSQFESSPVKAPISGTITELPAEVGSTVNPQMSIAQVSKMDDLQIRTDVAERFIGRMKTGLRAIITTEAFPDRKYEGRISKLSPVVDPQSRMMEVKIDLEGGSGELKTGMFVKVKIITDRKEDVIKIPMESVVERFEDTYVFVVEDAPEDSGIGEDDDVPEGAGEEEFGVVTRRRISVGTEVDQQTEVLEGLEAGEEVVTQGQTLLEEGAKVRVISREDQE